MEFEKRKASTLALLNSTNTDKSPKGSVDTPIIPLLKTLNQNPNYFTTSSCSGRISILSQPLSPINLTKKKARGGSWIFVSHQKADPETVIQLVFPSESTESTQSISSELVSELVFRFEPLIIAVECRDISSANSLVSLAISSGFRESGITNVNKRVIIAIRCSIRMEVPLGNTEKIMVTPEYVRYLVQVANQKMDVNLKRTERFFELLKCNESRVLDNGNCLLPMNGVELVCDNLQLDHNSQLTNGNASEMDSESGFIL